MVWLIWISVFFVYVLLQEEDGYTGLHHAAKLGKLEIVNMLLETGQVDVNAQVKEEPTCQYLGPYNNLNLHCPDDNSLTDTSYQAY